MKKGLVLIMIVAVLVAGYFIFFDKKNKPEVTSANKTEKPPRLAISKNPPAFNAAFAAMLTDYYNLKNDFINWDSTKAGEDAKTLGGLALQLPLQTLQADTSLLLTAKNFTGAVATQSDKITAAKTIAEKRRAFSVLSDNLYSLINTVRYDNEVIYYDACPMAFNESEQAYWLSRDSAIQNPYLGNKHPKYKDAMVTCGSVEQTVDYGKK